MSDRIVIVDDSLTVRMDLGEAFAKAGFETSLCASGEEAKAAISAGVPALVILDVLLPDSDGVELLRELKHSEETAKIPVILLSSEAEVRDRIRGLKTGASAYVGKPYDASYVVARARALLGGERKPDDALKVLLIDDSLTFREALGEALRVSGYEVILASSGDEGLRQAADVRPNAIVVDGVMPGLDGTAVIRRIRLDPGLHRTPCLLLTAEEGGGEVRALDAGADAYVRKAEGTDVVLARLGAMLRAAEDSRDVAYAPSSLPPRRLLAVDDSVTYLEELSHELTSAGYEVIKATSGEDALELLSVEQVDCILLDLLMPGLSGTETCKRIKASSALRHLPLIMLTALTDPEAMIDGINAGADDYVAKSADFDVLKARLRAQLRRKQFEDENRSIRERMLLKEAEAQASRELAETKTALLQQLERKNEELSSLNLELQTFAYSVSHDLRQPLRSMDGFSKLLLEKYDEQLDERARHYLGRVRSGAQRMGQLIEGLLLLSRVHANELRRTAIALDAIATCVIERFREAEPTRRVEFVAPQPLPARADGQLVETALENLLGNAWKFTAGREDPHIELNLASAGEEPVYAVRDNGVGFNMDYADKLFGPFQRLHSEREFPGTGIGLATVQRIIHRHGGRIWAESVPGVGTAFYFTLGPVSGRETETVGAD